MEAVIFIGLQGAGKSTFYHQRFQGNHVHISLDVLKTRHRELTLLQQCLNTKQQFVVDNTNPAKTDREAYIRPAKGAGYRVAGFYFQSRVEDCHRRNSQRPEPEQIPFLGLLGTAKRLQLPRYDDVIAEYSVVCSNIEAYVPGSFYLRELPCLLAVLGRVVEPLDIAIVDGYVSLGDKPGMGMELWEALNRQRPIIGVAKTSFHGARAAEVLRGKAKIPLFVTAAGIDVIEAASNIGRMAGSFRVPSLLSRVDRVAREVLKRSIQSSPK